MVEFVVDWMDWSVPATGQNLGACIRLNGLSIVPSEFGISFDSFRTMHLCRLVWRQGDFLGVAFQELAAIEGNLDRLR
jgi:hypothetical protein